MNDSSPLKFPTDFPVKIMGRDTPEFHAAVKDIVTRHAGSFDSLPVSRQPSSEGRFVSITVTVKAENREQLDALYRALTSHELILMVL